ncbi:MAG: 1-acyl-sn-glycerol-3-phosphate acyltransferase [Bdellovibrionaceae bacterium]|nr:1-acyl-sn-glycerol-3-phosphate acyltransferase [Bdellovibrio sp.]
MLTIGMVGLVLAYFCSAVFFAISYLTQKIPKISILFLHAAEYIQCFAIRFLLTIQPWLNCKNNFQSIYGFFDVYKTRKVMFVANHRSNLDTFIMISLIPGLRGLAKSSLFYNIFFAPIMYLSGFIPAKKGDVNSFLLGLKKVKSTVLERNRPVLIFPETTRCQKNFGSIGKFSRATFDIALETKALIVPVFIFGTDDVMGRGDLFLRPNHPVHLELLPVVDTAKFNSSTELSKYIWQQIADAQNKHRELLCS